jgi:hypothetical protein
MSSNIECHNNALQMFGIDDFNAFNTMYCDTYDGYYVLKPEIYIAIKKLSNRLKDEELLMTFRKNQNWEAKWEEKADYYLNSIRDSGWDLPYVNRERAWEGLFDSYDEIYIFGAGSIAEHVFKRAKLQGLEKRINGFIVSKMTQAPEFCNKIVLTMDAEINKSECLILVAVALQNMKTTTTLLKKRGFTNIVQAYQFWIK